MDTTGLSPLQELARLSGLETEFYDGLGVYRQPPDEIVLKILQSLGAELESVDDAGDALRRHGERVGSLLVQPVIVRWGSSPLLLDLQAPASFAGHLHLSIDLEEGGHLHFEVHWHDLPVEGEHQTLGGLFQKRRWAIEAEIPFGYHTGHVELGGTQSSFFIFSAPNVAYAGNHEERLWGAFIPVYSLHSRRSWGAGDLTDLTEFSNWLADNGGRFIGTLPLFASFLDRPLDPSPYAPVSRLFWNEFYVDPQVAPEWGQSAEARALFDSVDIREEISRLRSSRLVDYRTQMRLKRVILEELARTFFGTGGRQSEGFQAFLNQSSQVEDYAAFRATHEAHGVPWHQWEARPQSGTLLPGDYDPACFEYHLYAQWLVQQQFNAYRASAKARQLGLYLDLPLGVHPDGYDAWRDRESFAQNVSGGAPPDGFFTGGQNWGFRPLHPERCRHLGYSYFRKTLTCLLQNTDMIRIDHAMSLQRLYWVPFSAEASDGVYVNYSSEELFAILVIESHRKKCVLIGEDLGTVPPNLRERMDRHGVNRMYVGQFESSAYNWPPANPAPTPVVASLNTHDTPSSYAFFRGMDIDQRHAMGLLTAEAREQQKEERLRMVEALQRFFGNEGALEEEETLASLLRSWLLFLAKSPARFVQVNLEDLWLEPQPQNVPGTGPEKPNWKLKTRLSIESFIGDQGIADTFRAIDTGRQSRSE